MFVHGVRANTYHLVCCRCSSWLQKVDHRTRYRRHDKRGSVRRLRSGSQIRLSHVDYNHCACRSTALLQRFCLQSRTRQHSHVQCIPGWIWL